MAVNKNKFKLLLLLLFCKAIIVSFFVLFAGISLSPDEAQYWTWSKDLDLGYYSKPPGISWQIAFGTFLFGDNEFGVRFGSLVLGTLLPISVYFLAKRVKLSDISSFWAAILMAFTPLGFLATFFAITDVGVVLFWTLALIPLMEAIEKEGCPNYAIFGLLVAFGALFKWQIYWIWLLALALTLFFPYLRSKRIFLGFMISLLGLLPSIYWNIQHEWATFKHVGATLTGSEGIRNKGNFFDFLGAQMALASPVVFFMLLWSFKSLKKAKQSLQVLGASFFIVVGLHCILAIFKKMQGNWCDYAYPAGFVYLAWFCSADLKKRKWLQIGIVLSVVLLLTIFAFQKMDRIPFRINPFKHNIGWKNIDSALAQSGYQPDQDFLFASSYQNTSLLSFYNNQQKRAYFLNINAIRKNQFSFWPQMNEKEVNKDGFFILIDSETKLKNELNQYQNRLSLYFKKTEVQGIFPLSPGKDILILKCIEYNGLIPNLTNSY